MEAEGLRKAGKLAAAQKGLETLVASVPGYLAAWSLLGSVHQALNDDWSALKCFHRATLINSRDFAALINLARCYLALGASEHSEATLRLAEQVKPDATETLIGLARIQSFRKDYEGAMNSFSHAHRLNPNNIEVIHSLGESLDHMGRGPEAIDAFITALRLLQAKTPSSPNIASILYSIAANPHFSENLDLLKEVEAFEKVRTDKSGETSAKLLYVKSYALEKSGKYSDAWQALTSANDAVWRSGASAEAVATREKNSASLSEAKSFPVTAGRPIDPDQPITLFITGASRSGKSTLETLVAHGLKDVKSGYECGLVEAAVARAAQENSLPNVTRLGDLPQALSSQFATCLSQQIREHASGNRVFTDTLPNNIHYAGGAVRANPNAFFIFVNRDPDDNALRCLQRTYGSGNAYSYNVAECRYYLGWYREMMQAWSERLPDRSLTVNYEELVSEPRRILEALSRAIGVELTTDTPKPGDDRLCARPFREFMEAAQTA